MIATSDGRADIYCHEYLLSVDVNETLSKGLVFSKSQTDYWLCKNPMSGVPNFLALLYHFSQYCFLVPYVAGVNQSSPHNPHPTIASVGNDPKNANIHFTADGGLCTPLRGGRGTGQERQVL